MASQKNSSDTCLVLKEVKIQLLEETEWQKKGKFKTHDEGEFR